MPDFVFDPRATPKAQLRGGAAAVERAARRLRPVFGAPVAFADGLGWNLNKRDFAQAERLLQDATPGSAAARSRHRLLLSAEAAAPATVRVEARILVFTGWGRPFRLGPKQATLAGTPGDGAVKRVRYAYYR